MLCGCARTGFIVGEVRGPEVMDMFQAMNTGHEGSMTTIHANSPRDALLRLETMVSLAGYQIPQKALRNMISSSFDVVIHLARHTDGVRRIVSFSEITGMEQEVISLQDIFVFDRHGVAEDGKILGQYASTGIRPQFADRCKIYGAPIPDHYFMPTLTGKMQRTLRGCLRKGQVSYVVYYYQEISGMRRILSVVLVAIILARHGDLPIPHRAGSASAGK